MPSKTARSWQGSPRRRAFVASCCLCSGGTSCRRAPGIRNLGAALLSGTARKRCVLAWRRSLSHSVGNALGTLGPQLSRRGAKGHREGQECHQAALCHAARDYATATKRGTLALVLKHIHLSPTVCTWSVALRLPHVIAYVALEFPIGVLLPSRALCTPAAKAAAACKMGGDPT